MALSENPNLALIPSGYKSGKIYSVLPTSGVGDFDFSRSGGATRINSQGLIETVADGVPRLNYPLIDGKVVGCPSHLLENESRNLIQYSEDFSNSYWTKADTLITSNSVISPDGTLNADKLTEGNSISTKLMFKSGISTLGTISVFAKKGDDNNRLFQIRRDGGSNSWSWFNLEDGIILSEENGVSTIDKLGNGWYRCSFTPTNSNGTIVFGISNGGTGRSVSYQGDETSGVYIFGAQLEQGSYPTSYIPNYGTALGVTRSAETANNSGDASTFNDSEGVLMAEMSVNKDNLHKRISISNGSTSQRIVLWFNSNNTTINVFINGGETINIPYVLGNLQEQNKYAFKYKENDCSLWINGIEVATDISATMPSGLSELAFDDGGGGLPFYGNTKQIQYYDSALTDSELETLTSWVSFSDMAEGQLYTIE